ncbi:hypothetical protein MUK42_27993 [Musa troglodytarum]|uniref:Uncharacterized protein n=1 Tax=Musa troglodytarum TaxID=320322 RepID=A0A9E7JWB6_9LILI|nr:hypothetical protein MUK42_27993 [Musa troglodytarum]
MMPFCAYSTAGTENNRAWPNATSPAQLLQYIIAFLGDSYHNYFLLCVPISQPSLDKPCPTIQYHPYRFYVCMSSCKQMYKLEYDFC